MIKERALIQQKAASDEARNQLRKTRYRIAKKDYQEHLRKKNSLRKTLSKHIFIILNYTPPLVEVSDEEDENSEDSEDEEDIQEYNTPDVVYDRSSDIEVEASDEDMDEEIDEID